MSKKALMILGQCYLIVLMFMFVIADAYVKI